MALLRDGRYNEAKDAFDRAVKINPSDYTSYGNLAVVQSYLKDDENAYLNFNKAFELEPGLDSLKFDYAALLTRMGKYDEAIAAYNDYLKKYPDDTNAYLNLGILYKGTQKPKEAIAVLQKGSKLDGTNTDIKNELGKSYFDNKEFDKAIIVYDQILSKNKGNLQTLYNKALALQGAKEFKNAQTIFSNLLKEPVENLAKYNLEYGQIQQALASNYIAWANYYNDKKDYKTAKETYAKALAINPDDTGAYAGLAKTYENMGIKEMAVENFEKAIQIEPENAGLFMQYGESLEHMNELEQAQSAFSKAIELDDKSFDAYVLSGDNYLKQKEFKKAIGQFEKALEINPDDDSVAIKIGNGYKYLSDNNKALEYYTKTLDINPLNENAYFNIGLINYENENYEEAVANFSKAIELKDDFAYAYWGLGSCYEVLKNPKDAIFNYEKYCEYAPDEDSKEKAKQKVDELYKELVK